MGYSAYFLIVADFIRFARERGIMITCRGSAPGSIVTYSLGITPVDPLAYGLPFERFLNPDRVTMPDIDIDFQDSRRDEVIQYVTRKYGDDRVAQIITFGTLGAKAAIRDVGRAMGLTYAEADRVAKAVPNELNISLARAVETSPPLRELMAGDDRVDKLIGIAKQLEGVSRHASTHAAGIVISREPLTEIMPLQRATDGKTTMTQFEMHACEALGLLKFDFLGLINLTILADAVDLVEKHRGVRLDVDMLPLDDRKTFELLSHRRDDGRLPAGRLRHAPIRQGAQADRGARPGRHGRPLPPRTDGEHPRLHPPQARRGAGDLPARLPRARAAGHVRDLRVPGGHHDRRHRDGGLHRSRGRQPLLRDPQEEGGSVLRQHEAKFKAGAKKKGIPPHIVDKVFHEFEPFARYGFNKAHATCYGLIAYQTAYLKANYPIEFMTAVLNGFRERAEKVAAVIAECRRLGIEVRPPDVQKSHGPLHRRDRCVRRARGDPLRPGRHQERRRGSDRGDRRRPRRRRGARSVPLAGRPLPARRPAHHQQARHGVADQGQRGGLARDRRARCWPPWTTRSRTASATSATSPPGSRRCSTSSRVPADESVQFLDGGEEIPRRERLRWEKELIGLYLSEHPLSDIEASCPTT